MKRILLCILSLTSLSLLFGGDAETPEDSGSTYQPNKTPEELGTDTVNCSPTAGVQKYDLDGYIPVPVQKNMVFTI